jgi:hypothetical protein
LKVIFVFSKISDYDAFVKDEKLEDKTLGIHLDLKAVFE